MLKLALASGYLGVHIDLLPEPVEVRGDVVAGHVQGGLRFVLEDLRCPLTAVDNKFK